MHPILSRNSQVINGMLGKAQTVMVVLVVLLLAQSLRAVTLADFGYQNWKVNGTLATGSRPALVILVNFPGQTLPQSASFYSNTVFNAAQTSMNGFYQAVSDGAFGIRPGGVVSLTLPHSQCFTNYEIQGVTPPFAGDPIYVSNIVANAMSSGQFNFSAYDARHDGHITPDELAILIISADTSLSGLFGGSRPCPTVSVPGLNYDWGPGTNDPFPAVALMGYFSPFIVWCEELEETWGTKDIYDANMYCPSMTLSPQSCFFNYSQMNFVFGSYYYLDPWDRLELGWCRPRIYSLTAGGIATISAAQAGDPTSPIILYDPARGPGEFYILEYRTSTNSVYGPGYDLGAGNDLSNPVSYGLVIWHVQLNAGYNFIKVTDPNGITNTTSVWSENSPDLTPGQEPVLWGSNAYTPNLKWMDGTPTLTTIHVKPFNPGDNTITVEWLSAEDTWVDFNYNGSPQSGTLSNPFNTMAAGISGVSYGGTLHLKTGASAETPVVTKPMKIVGYNGPASVGF